MNRNLYVVMGITGSGKSTVGAILAKTLGLDFVEGDDYHPPENVRRMAAGIPLTDDDRADWLQALAERLSEATECRRRARGDVLGTQAIVPRRSARCGARGCSSFFSRVRERWSPSVLLVGAVTSCRRHCWTASLRHSRSRILTRSAWACDIKNSPQEIVNDIVARASA